MRGAGVGLCAEIATFRCLHVTVYPCMTDISVASQWRVDVFSFIAAHQLPFFYSWRRLLYHSHSCPPVGFVFSQLNPFDRVAPFTGRSGTARTRKPGSTKDLGLFALRLRIFGKLKQQLRWWRRWWWQQQK